MGIAVLAAWAGGMLTFAILVALTLTAVILMRPEIGLGFSVLSSILWLVGAIRVPGLPFLGPAQIFAALNLTAWAIWALTRRVPLTYAPHMRPLALFFLVIGAAVFTTHAPLSDSMTGIQKYAMAFLPYFLVANIPVTRPSLERVVWFILVTMTASVTLAFVELLLPGIEHSLGTVELGARIDPSLDIGLIKRVSGGMGDSNWFSYTMATGAPLTIYMWRTNRRLIVRLFAVVLFAAMCYGIILSYTRTGVVGLTTAILYLLWRRKLPWAPIAIALILALVTTPLWIPKGFTERVLSVKYLKSGGSTAIREEIVSIAGELFMKRPLFGYGYQQYGPLFMELATSPEGREMARRANTGEEPAAYLQAHSIFLDLGVTFGLVGLLPFVAFMVMVLRELAEIRDKGSPRDEELATCVTASLTAFLICGLGGHAQELKILWVLTGLVAALRRIVLEGRAREPSPVAPGASQ